MNRHFPTLMVVTALSACGLFSSNICAAGVIHLARFKDASISESSGLAASKRYPGVFWTHNDQGHAPVLFAVNRQGKTLAHFQIVGANIEDWEDVAVDNAGTVYIADTGNNNLDRSKVAVYAVREPQPTASGSVRVQQAWTLSYPLSGRFNGEAFFLGIGYGWLVGKDLTATGAPVYRFPLAGSGNILLQRAGTLRVGSRVTSAAVSTDGTVLGILTENGPYAFSINGIPTRAFFNKPTFAPFDDTTMEGGTFAGDGFLVSTERGELLLFNQPAFRKR